MKFEDFITRQRLAIFIIGLTTFVLSTFIAHEIGLQSLASALFIDLAASAITVVFTALIIDYLGIREEVNKTKNAAGLAEDEIRSACFRVKWRMARLFGMKQTDLERDKISNRQQARDYLQSVEGEVEAYLRSHSLTDSKTPLFEDRITSYIDRLQLARTDLEQTLLLYEYAMGYSLREKVLSLRSELQISENVLSFIDASESLNDANRSLIRILSQSIYEEIENVLSHDSRQENGIKISEKARKA